MGIADRQNVLDLWTIQETITEVRPALLIETGTWDGGSALFYAQLMDLLGEGRVLTIDIDDKNDLDHPRVEFLHGSSTAPETMEKVHAAAEATDGPVMVILDGDHSATTSPRSWSSTPRSSRPGSFLLSQDGVIDEARALPRQPARAAARQPGVPGAPPRVRARRRAQRPVPAHAPPRGVAAPSR